MLSTLKYYVGLLAGISFLFSPVLSHAQTVTAAFSPGDLIKGSLSTVYYFAHDGKRYVFPNEKTYFTWYVNFDTVKIIPDSALATIPLGGNVTYRPGVKMVKITTDPKTYVVEQGGILRHVTTEQLANTLYGLNWKNRIDDIPDAFFVNYRTGTPIQTASDYRPADVTNGTTTIAQDKQLDETKITISIGDMSAGFVPTTLTIKKGTTVTWTNRDINPHTVMGSGSNLAGINSGMIQPGQSYTKVFATAGSFDYHCTIHPSMQGTINVLN